MLSPDNRKINSTECVDVIEKFVYRYLKPMGFRKFGRTLHRFVDGDISQIIHFQNGCPGKGVFDLLWVNLGIRVPECAERTFEVKQPQKKYYQEYECNIRCRLGALVDGKDTYYDLREEPEEIGKDIVQRLKEYAIPIFDALNCRESILQHRREYAGFDQLNRRMILLEEAMIFGRRGEWEQAVRLLREYYNKTLAEYQHDVKFGRKMYLREGDSISYKNWETNQMETVTAEKDGDVTIFNANPMHLRYQEELAKKLNIMLEYKDMNQ